MKSWKNGGAREREGVGGISFYNAAYKDEEKCFSLLRVTETYVIGNWTRMTCTTAVVHSSDVLSFQRVSIVSS